MKQNIKFKFKFLNDVMFLKKSPSLFYITSLFFATP